MATLSVTTQTPLGHDPSGKDPSGKDPSGKDPLGWDVSTEAAGARDPASGLSAVERVLVRDSWNKFIVQDAVLAGLFFERLISRLPGLEEAFGPTATRAPVEFLKLFDLAVRGLDRATEQCLREAYQVAPGALEARCRTIADCGAFFATFGMTAEAWAVAREVFLWAFSKAAYLEEYERTDLARGPEAALSRFFVRHIEAPMLAVLEHEAAALSPEVVARMRAGAEAMLTRPQDAGAFFYETLFDSCPDIVGLFRTADMDALSRHLIDTVVFLGRAADRPQGLRDELRTLAKVHHVNQIPPEEYDRLVAPLLATLSKFGHPLDDAMTRGWQVLFDRVARIVAEPMHMQERLLAEARTFLDQLAEELEWTETKRRQRWSVIVREVRATGTYTHTAEELDYGAKLAWRNAPKCIGRISWKNLIVRDRRHVTDADGIAAECLEHMRVATNGGNIEIVLTVFAPARPNDRWGPRLWNSQLVRYAAYEMPDGSVRGDRANLELTRAIMGLGWTPPEARGDYDILPLVIDLPGEAPRLYPLDPAEVLEVPISHPTVPGIADLGMKWCAVPAISNFNLEIGGIRYSCTPFNGWFMGTEIARDLWEEGRYDRALDIAAALDLDTSSEQTLWRDRAFLELNVAILHSFQKARVTLVDHQTAARQFMIHDLREKRAGRECPAQGSWIVPPSGGSTTPVWHHEMRDFHLKPSYVYAPDRWLAHVDEALAVCPAAEAGAQPRTARPLILYASETGTAEGYAHQAARRLASLAPSVRAMDDVRPEDLAATSRVLMIVATCRDGEVPQGGAALLTALAAGAPDALEGTRFAVLGIGNRIYPQFCRAAQIVDAAMADAGAERMATLETADEIAGQADTAKRWIELFFKQWCTDQPVHAMRRSLIELIPPRREGPRSTDMFGTVRFNDEMLSGTQGGAVPRSTRSIGIDLPAPQAGAAPEGAARYAAGDHVAIYPHNPADLVARLCGHLGLSDDTWFRALGASNEALARFRDGYSVRQLLTEDLDLSLPEAPEELFAAMVEVGGEGSSQLQAWLDVLNGEDDRPERRALLDRLREDYLTVVDLFDAFGDSVPPFEILIQLLARLKPRLYSIASSPRVHPDLIRILVGVHSVQRPDGRVSRGVASHFLAALQPGTPVRLALKGAPRHLPDQVEGPILMIAAGTGIAPLIGALEDRVARKASGALPETGAPGQGGVALYFGCRNEGEFLERERIRSWRADGHLSRAAVAFSRAGPVKSYVQDAIDADGAAVAGDLLHPGCHVMICGDAKMAHDVEHRLQAILQREGGLSYAGAVELLDRMRREGRYIGDIWGVQLNYDIAVPEMVRANYNRGASWLRRLRRSLNGSPKRDDSIRQI
ncbi:MAG: nitric oxide synthase oxygenase [Alkalilacustris sp.]